jgi:hypothetical protein
MLSVARCENGPRIRFFLNVLVDDVFLLARTGCGDALCLDAIRTKLRGGSSCLCFLT